MSGKNSCLNFVTHLTFILFITWLKSFFSFPSKDDEIGPYMNEFEDGIKDDLLMIGSIGLQEVEVSASTEHLHPLHINM